MYAYPIIEAASTPAKSNILPSLDVSNIVHWYEPNGTTRTGCMQSLELIDGTWWGSAEYEQLPGIWILENRHTFGFFEGVGPEFALQPKQAVWFRRGDKWQAATISDFYLESNVWFVIVGFKQWYGVAHDELPFDQIRTTAPDLAEDQEYAEFVSKADFWADYEYEDRRDSR